MTAVKLYVKNSAYQQIEALKTNRNKRYRQRRFLVEGVRSLKEAVKNGWRIHSLIYCSDRLSGWAGEMIATVKTDVNYDLTPELLKDLSDKTDTSELMAVIGMRKDAPDTVRLSDNPFLVLFDRPSNKGNLGTMIRSCDALGVDALILTGHGVDLYEPDVVVSAMGSFFNLPVLRFEDNGELYRWIDGLKARYPGFVTVGTTAHHEAPIWSEPLSGPLMLMIGNETMGLNRAFRESCDRLCTIPMAQTAYASSFNVSCAASIMMYEIVRQRQQVRDSRGT